jgi:hypothetical protein
VTAIEPPFNSWPVCEARVTTGGTPYTCDLPARHFLDGERLHHDPATGRMWSLQWMVDDAETR